MKHSKSPVLLIWARSFKLFQLVFPFDKFGNLEVDIWGFWEALPVWTGLMGVI